MKTEKIKLKISSILQPYLQRIQKLEYWQYLHVVQPWFDSRNLRERCLLLATVLLVILMFWKALLFDNLTFDASTNSKDSANIKQGVSKLEQKINAITEEINESPLIALNEEIDKLKQANNTLVTKIGRLTAQLIPPKDMVMLLYDILRGSNLKVIKMNNIPEKPLFSAEVIEKSDEGLQVYKHGLELVLQGDFNKILNFLEKLERLKWKFIWNKLSYKVVAHPTAEVNLVIQTLSLSRGWVGV